MIHRHTDDTSVFPRTSGAVCRLAALEVVRLGLDERPDPREAQGAPDPRVPAAGPGEPRAHPVAAIPVGGTGIHTREETARPVAVGRVYGGRQPIKRIVHE